jgi:hypothetical protein
MISLTTQISGECVMFPPISSWLGQYRDHSAGKYLVWSVPWSTLNTESPFLCIYYIISLTSMMATCCGLQAEGFSWDIRGLKLGAVQFCKISSFVKGFFAGVPIPDMSAITTAYFVVHHVSTYTTGVCVSLCIVHVESFTNQRNNVSYGGFVPI